jgi:hypothetical protein
MYEHLSESERFLRSLVELLSLLVFWGAFLRLDAFLGLPCTDFR